MIRPCQTEDTNEIFAIINDAAKAYQGVIPNDCYHTPYMSIEALLSEMEKGVRFWGFEEAGQLLGVMGIQDVKDVTLIRHAYVRTQHRNRGIGGKLLQHLKATATKPVLIGTWADAAWAIRFYEKHGFHVVRGAEKDRLLKTYWTIPQRQVETSIVLVERPESQGKPSSLRASKDPLG